MKNKVFDALKFKEQLEKKPRILFSKFFISIILLVVQLGLLITLDVVFYKQAFAFYTLFEILGLLVIIVLVNDKNVSLDDINVLPEEIRENHLTTINYIKINKNDVKNETIQSINQSSCVC